MFKKLIRGKIHAMINRYLTKKGGGISIDGVHIVRMSESLYKAVYGDFPEVNSYAALNSKLDQIRDMISDIGSWPYAMYDKSDIIKKIDNILKRGTDAEP